LHRQHTEPSGHGAVVPAGWMAHTGQPAVLRRRRCGSVV